MDHGNCDVNIHDSGNGATALHIAAGFGRTECVQLLINRGAEVDSVDNEKWTPLHCASAKGHLQTVRTLLDQGADIEAQMWDGGNALHMASKEGHVQIVKELVERRAKLNVPVRNGQTALDLAVMRGQSDATAYLRSVDAPEGSFNMDATVSAMDELNSLRKTNGGAASQQGLPRATETAHYDVFLSYRSIDAGMVRNVADALMAAGVSVWFAEYEIQIENYDDFQACIDQGIKASGCLICFLGEGYFNSGHCVNELEQFVKSKSDALKRISCIGIASREAAIRAQHKYLRDVPYCDYAGDFCNLIKFVGNQVKKKIAMPEFLSHPVVTRCFEYRGQDFQMALGPEWIRAHGVVFKAMRDADAVYPPLTAKIAGCDVLLTLTAGPNSELLSAPLTGELDDRTAYQLVRKNTGVLIHNEGALGVSSRVCGLHLVSVDGHCHASFSRTVELGLFGSSGWERKYAISIYSKVHNIMIEYLVSFGIPRCTKEQFHRISPFLDKIACSLTVGARSRCRGVNKSLFMGCALMIPCWLPSAYIPWQIKLICLIVLSSRVLANSCIADIQDFRDNVGVSVKSVIHQMRRLIYGVLLNVSGIGMIASLWGPLRDWLLIPPGRGIFLFFSVTLGVDIAMKSARRKIATACPKEPLPRDLFLLKESISNSFSIELFNFAFSVGLCFFLLAGSIDMHWGFILVMAVVVFIAYSRIRRTIQGNVERIKCSPPN